MHFYEIRRFKPDGPEQWVGVQSYHPEGAPREYDPSDCVEVEPGIALVFTDTFDAIPFTEEDAVAMQKKIPGAFLAPHKETTMAGKTKKKKDKANGHAKPKASVGPKTDLEKIADLTRANEALEAKRKRQSDELKEEIAKNATTIRKLLGLDEDPRQGKLFGKNGASHPEDATDPPIDEETVDESLSETDGAS